MPSPFVVSRSQTFQAPVGSPVALTARMTWLSSSGNATGRRVQRQPEGADEEPIDVGVVVALHVADVVAERLRDAGIRSTAGIAPKSWFSGVDAVERRARSCVDPQTELFTPWTTNPLPTHRPMSGGSSEKFVPA